MFGRLKSGIKERFEAFHRFYWKKKWKIIHAARRRGIDISLRIEPRVPTAGITGSVGKTTTCRMVAAILRAQGHTVALATTQGTYIGEEVVRVGDSAGGEHARRLLRDPRVEAGVFELARGGLIRDGMVLAWCDVGAALNIYDNHIGLDGVRCREDLARVKKIVVQNARHLAVLNADDPLCLAMREHVRAPRTCLVSMRPDNPAVLEHRARNGLAVFLDDTGEQPSMQAWEGGECISRLESSSIPATYGGYYRPAVNNALFAAAVAYGMGIEWTAIWDALKGFTSSYETNPGLMNFFDGLPFRLLITRASSPQAMEELSHFVSQSPVRGKKHVMFCMVGDRPEGFLLDVARSAAGPYDSYICSDWDDLRGRRPGEVADILARGLRQGGVSEPAVSVAATHDEALSMAFSRPRPGGMLVVVTLSQQKAWRMAEELSGSVGL